MITDITLCFATSRRPHCAQRLILSARQRYPKLKIIVADQSDDDYQQSQFYRANNVEVVFVPADSGVSKARNAAVDRAETEYVLIADDDFILCDETELDIPVGILSADRSVDIIGGLLYDIYGMYDPEKLFERRWERYLMVDRSRKALIGLPIDYFAPESREFGRHPYFICDAVMNWAVMRRSVFARGACWDERYICNGEHEDFYLNIKLNTDIKVAYCPDFIAHHHHPKDLGYLPQRERAEGWRLFGEKWDLSQYLTLPWGWMELDGASDTRMPSGELSEFLDRSGKAAPQPSKGDDVAVSFNHRGGAFVSRVQRDPLIVAAWLSNHGGVRLVSETAEGGGLTRTASRFELGDLSDVRQLFVRPARASRVEITSGASTSIHVISGTYDGSRIGSMNANDKIYLGFRVINPGDGSILTSSVKSDVYTPLTNDLSDFSFQYVNIVADVDPGEYLVEVDFWIEGIGWVHRNEGALPLRVASAG